MAWNYGGQPDQDPVDAVRFRVGDTDASDPQLTDEEIGFLLTVQSPAFAAAAAAEALAGRYARQVNKTIGKLQIAASTRSKQYLDLAERLRAAATREGVAPFAGGLSILGKEATELDNDFVQPPFSVDTMETYGTTPRLSPRDL